MSDADEATDPAEADGTTEPLLSVRDLRTTFDTQAGPLRAVDGVSFDVEAGETVCVVGESGSGKTVTCESVARLLDDGGRVVDGEVRYRGTDLTAASEERLRSVRGDEIGYVFQNPQGALDPVYTVGEQITEAIHIHREVPEAEARRTAVDLLDRVGIPNPTARADDYPHEFSSGMRQRVATAVALAADPDLLIADEPTTALDVTLQASVLRLFRELQADREMAILFVTHDLGVVAEMADRVVVMYAGKVMERGPVETVLSDPAHPYTRALLRCLPGRPAAAEGIEGHIPDPTAPPDGCRFHPRCPHAVEDCRQGSQPPFEDAGESQTAACVFYGPDHDAETVRSTPVDAAVADGSDAVTDGGDPEDRGGAE
jgi:peptide/nickel transport system ATP-binding protein